MYCVTANLCDGSDYVATWDGGTFERSEDAIRRYESWWPPRDEVDEAMADLVDGGINPDDVDLQIGVWDEEGNDIRFYSESMFATA